MTDAPVSPMAFPHIVLFMDFLGFTDAVKSGDADRLSGLAELLTWLAEAENSFDVKGDSLPDGSYKITTHANITTFSDNVVVSFPFAVNADAATEPWLKGIWLDLVFARMQEIIAAVSVQALNMDMLVRGGMSLGDLWHRNRVVIGKAMIDAYELEANVAVYPRVAVSPRLLDENDEIAKDHYQKRLLIDEDGVWHLNYFEEMAVRAIVLYGEAESRIWRSTSLQRITEQVKSLTSSDKVAAAAKWHRFGRYFDKGTVRLAS